MRARERFHRFVSAAITAYLQLAFVKLAGSAAWQHAVQLPFRPVSIRGANGDRCALIHCVHIWTPAQNGPDALAHLLCLLTVPGLALALQKIERTPRTSIYGQGLAGERGRPYTICSKNVVS